MEGERKPSEEYVIIRHRPGYRLRRSIILLAFSIVCAGIGYAVGSGEAGINLKAGLETRKQLRAELESLRADYTEARQQAILLERGRAIDRSALTEARKTMAELEKQIVKQQNDLAFYRSIMAPSETEKGLQVAELDVQPSAILPGYGFKLMLVQIGGNQRYVSGNVDLEVIGMEGDQAKTIPLEQLSPETQKTDTRFRFRYFQEIDGTLILPEGFEPLEIKVIARESGGKRAKVDRSFDWPIVTEHSP